MRFLTLCIATLLVSISTAQAAPPSIMQCNEASEPPVHGIPWLPGGAQENVCHAFVGGSPQYQAYDGQATGKILAFRNGLLVGIKEDRAELLPGDTMTFAESDWIEHASIGPLGQLWWGRTARWHVFAGQETQIRLRKGVSMLPIKEQMAVSRWYLARMQALLAKAPMPTQAGDEKYTVFNAKKIASYHQVGSTTATFEGGLGGAEGLIPPGRIDNAKLSLEIGPVLSGVLSFDVKIDGVPRAFTMPVVSETEPFRLFAAPIGSGQKVRCEKRPGRAAKEPLECVLTPQAQYAPGEWYDGRGAFFGDHAELAAFKFQFTLNVQPRDRKGVLSTGVIILERNPL